MIVHGRVIQVPQEVILKASEQCSLPAYPKAKKDRPRYVFLKRRCQKGEIAS